MFVCGVGSLGVESTVDGSWTHLPTHSQQYCDPALLVTSNNLSKNSFTLKKSINFGDMLPLNKLSFLPCTVGRD